MKRSVSEVARVLRADVSQTKQWSALFGDFLSHDARPAKGRPRAFSDDDLLVLLFVNSNWSSSPDTEDIRRGLEDDRHREESFMRQLYAHTPLFQEPPEDLDETWRHGFLLCGASGQEFLELARNYRHVAATMLDAALASGYPMDHAYPVLFAYRHTLELYLKIVGEIDEATHSISRCVRLVEKRHGHKIGEPVRNWMLELDRIDPAGTAFRYARDESQPMRYTEYWLDLRQFKFAMGEVFSLIDHAILSLRSEGRPVKQKRGQ